MAKFKHILSSCAALALTAMFSACDSEKDLIIYDGDLPIMSETLYMVGSAAPCGWTLSNPTPFTPSDEDPLVFTYEGSLGIGEIKLCLNPSEDWNIPFIRPVEAGQNIGKENYTDEPFTMAIDPDDKWNVVEPGEYRLTFNLRNWTFSTEFLNGPKRPDVVPIEADAVYVIGWSTAAGWNIDEAIETKKESQYIFTFEGTLGEGEFRACTERSWGTHIRPVTNNMEINENGVEDPDFIYVGTPDTNWRVTKAGKYRITFDLEHWKISVKYGVGGDDPDPVVDPIETNTLYMLGTSTKGGWDGNAMTPLVQDPSDPYVFSYEGTLSDGELKLYTRTGDYESQPAIRPAMPGAEIGKDNIVDAPFAYAVAPDNKWNVKAGKYRLVFNLRTHKMSSTYLGEPEYEWPPVTPIATDNVYILGDASSAGWGFSDNCRCTKESEYIFVYEGKLNTGSMRASTMADWGAHIRPKIENLEVGKDGCKNNEFVNVSTPDFNWKIVDAGTYRITFDLEKWTVKFEYLGN